MVRALPDEPHILAALGSAPPEGHTLAELALVLEVDDGRHRFLREALLALVRAGQAVRLGKRYALPPSLADEATGLASGVIRVVPDGRGFVSFGDEALEEVMVQPADRGGALDGDTVELESWPGRRRREGRVTRVLARGRSQLTGTLELARRRLLADDPRLPREAEVLDLGPAGRRDDGRCVLARILEYPPRRGAPLGVAVARVLGEPGRLVTEVARAVAGHGIEEEFPLEVRQAAEAIPPRVREAELAGRVDLRALPFVTIDPRTARDFDDAVACEERGDGGVRVWVAVADVSAYVEEGSSLDREARRRGCSLYLPDRAIPMLPPALSSGICSLRPGEDRLALVVRFDLGPEAEPRGEELCAAVIHSRGQLDYAGVAATLEGGPARGRLEAYREHRAELEALARVAARLRRRRLARGSLDLDLPEAETVLDEDDPERVRTIVESRADAPLRRAYNLVEELMLAANEAVGRLFLRADAPTIWRVHAPPTADALVRLADRLAAYGIDASPEAMRSGRGMARLLSGIAAHRAARPLSYLVLRALKQAVYSVSNVGHFGLASSAYLHFTSPIRRYPDLHVHRLVKALLRERGAPDGGPLATPARSEGALGAIARESTAAERRSIEVEREVQSLYAAQLMRAELGLEGWGTVSGITGFGFFVTLDEPYVDGLCRFDRLGGYYELAEAEPRLYLRDAPPRAELGVISLGDRIKVRVVEASVTRRQVELAPSPGPGTHEPDPSLRRRDRRDRGRLRADRSRPRMGRGRKERGAPERRGRGRSGRRR